MYTIKKNHGSSAYPVPLQKPGSPSLCLEKKKEEINPPIVGWAGNFFCFFYSRFMSTCNPMGYGRQGEYLYIELRGKERQGFEEKEEV